jgi:hypothetical protein
MNRIASWLLVGTLALGVVACSDDDNTNNPPADNSTYQPTTAGSSWNYTTTELSGDSANPTTGATSTDSVYVSRTGLSMSGRTATEIITKSQDGTLDTAYISVDGGKVYQLLEMSISGMEGLGDVNLGSKWVLSADANASAEWTSIDTTITNVPFEYNGQTMMGTIAIKYTGKKTGTETVTVGSKSVETIKYNNRYTITMNIDTGVFGVLTIPVVRPIDVWYGKNVGMVKTYLPPTTLSIGGFGSMDVPGYSTVLTSYTIK